MCVFGKCQPRPHDAALVDSVAVGVSDSPQQDARPEADPGKTDSQAGEAPAPQDGPSDDEPSPAEQADTGTSGAPRGGEDASAQAASPYQADALPFRDGALDAFVDDSPPLDSAGVPSGPDASGAVDLSGVPDHQGSIEVDAADAPIRKVTSDSGDAVPDQLDLHPDSRAGDATFDHEPPPIDGSPDQSLPPLIDSGPATCSSNADCVAPLVCNTNLDSTCGAPRYTHVDVGDVYTCAVVSDGTVRCWGGREYGQFDDPALAPRGPHTVPGLNSIRSIGTGWCYTCVLLNNGEVDCSGRNNSYQLGCETAIDSPFGHLCTPYPAGSGVVQIVAGAERACVRKSDGSAECWGRNDHYDLGDGNNVLKPRPSAVLGISMAANIATGVWQGCALLADGALDCWGPNDRGQLGIGSYDATAAPAMVVGLDGINKKALAVATAEDHTCVIVANHSVECAGENIYGGLANGQTTGSAIPIPTAFTKPAILIAAGVGYTCAVLNDDTVQCAGKGTSGQLGNGGFHSSALPCAVSLPAQTHVQQIVAKYDHTCVLTDEGRILCWGANGYGQLGNGLPTDSSVPIAVPMP